jgi:hypothetical protein
MFEMDGSRSFQDFGVSRLEPLQSFKSFGKNFVEGCINTPCLITFICPGVGIVDLGTKDLSLYGYSIIRDFGLRRFR